MTVLLLMGVTAVHAQDSVLKQAKEEYQFAEYDKASELFAQVADNESASKADRSQALRYLARVYVAKNKQSKARDAVRQLLKMKPGAEFDPDVEPPPIMQIYYDVRKEMDGYGVQNDAGLKTLAVMDFSNDSVDERERFEGLEKGLPSMMINYLNGGTDLKVIERERIQWLLNELELQRDDQKVDQSTAVRTGKLLGAHSVVFGSYTVFEGQMMILARVVKVETGEVLLGEQVTGKPDEFFELIEELSTKITRSVNVEMEEAKMGTSETKSLDAMMAYSDGLSLLEDGKYRAAREKFLQAVEYDESFSRARIKAESIKPMVASTAGVEGSETSTTQMNR
ncbi:CsgG/HfaB family protein [Longibacter salinarum]|uniref:CsgG/HfaB family protein n=1 Tax=Longibacter salinarum TaxID=1850348 RepID=UPI0015CF4BDF|nr:CsgG/HfaB family protein [Longibacter salinarum]